MIATVLRNPDRVRLQVRVQARASRSRIVGLHGADSLKVQIAAAPVEGAANAALAELLAEVLEVRRADVILVAGERGRTKIVEISTSDPEGLCARVQSLA